VRVATEERLGRRIAALSMAVSGTLAAAKLTVGWLAGSRTVIADGMESAADVVASGLLLLGLWVASRPPDEDHPYGHGRFETLTGLALGAGLTLTGIFIVYGALRDLGSARPPPARYALWPVAISIVVKTVLSSIKFRLGKKIRSSVLVADAWNDAVDTLSGLTALVAVGLALYDPPRFLKADHYGAAAVGVIVTILGLSIIREATLFLMDTMPDAKKMAEIREAACSVPGTRGVEKCFARKTGLAYHVDLHLEVDPEMSVRDSHELASRVRDRLKERLDWVADVLVHVEPHET
jgi:cation diffusion facilitator family transporter